LDNIGYRQTRWRMSANYAHSLHKRINEPQLTH
jgi:hypothetical protein